jgi:hypothetical protein
LQQFINEHFDLYDQYYPFAFIERNRCCFLEENMTAFFQGLEKHIALVLSKIDEDDRNKLHIELTETEREGGKLFDRLVSNPNSFDTKTFELYFYDLCSLNAPCSLGIIFKKHTDIDLRQLFVLAISSFHLELIEKIVELGFDVKEPIDFGKHWGYFADFSIQDGTD